MRLRENIPSNDCDGRLESPMVNIVDSTYLPKRVGTKNIVPETLPDDARCPEGSSAHTPEIQWSMHTIPSHDGTLRW